MKKLLHNRKYFINNIKENSDNNDDDFDITTNNVNDDDNQIYFYSSVTKDNILTLSTKIKNKTNDLLSFSNVYRINKKNINIYLNINSEGGDLFQSLLGYDIIKNNTIPIVTTVCGLCCSGATFLSIVGKERYIYPNSYMLIHQLSTGVIGKYEDLKDEIYNCDNLMKIMKNIYSEHTKLPNKKLNEILKHDIYFSSKECLQYGLVDAIL